MHRFGAMLSQYGLELTSIGWLCPLSSSEIILIDSEKRAQRMENKSGEFWK